MYAYLSMFSICLAPSSFIYIPFNLPRQSFDLIFSFEIFTHTYHPKESELFVVSKNTPIKSRSIFYKRSIRTIAQCSKELAAVSNCLYKLHGVI